MAEFKRSFGGRDRGSDRRGRDDRRSRDRPFDSGRSFSRDSFDSGPRKRFEMHDATCDRCGKECQLPFRPTGSKPVYCRDCFGKNDGPSSEPRINQVEMSPAQYEQIMKKLDQIMRALKLN